MAVSIGQWLNIHSYRDSATHFGDSFDYKISQWRCCNFKSMQKTRVAAKILKISEISNKIFPTRLNCRTWTTLIWITHQLCWCMYLLGLWIVLTQKQFIPHDFPLTWMREKALTTYEYLIVHRRVNEAIRPQCYHINWFVGAMKQTWQEAIIYIKGFAGSPEIKFTNHQYLEWFILAKN